VELVRQWYFFLSQLSATLGEPLARIVNRIDLPLASALLLGLLGATAPCQLTTNLSAIAYVSRDLRDGRPWLEAVTSTLGKALVYMGAGFAFAFCPTLFLLFFGLAIPLGFRSNVGLLVPGLFAVGTALPLLTYAGLLAAGSGLADRYVRRLSRGHSTVRRVAGVVFILAGINDTLTYWLL